MPRPVQWPQPPPGVATPACARPPRAAPRTPRRCGHKDCPFAAPTQRPTPDRKLAREGGDPVTDSRRPVRAPTFAEAAERVWKDNRPAGVPRSWRNELSVHEQRDVTRVVEALEELGTALPRQYSSSIRTSRHGHMRELRVQSGGRTIRIFYTFDPRRTAILWDHSPALARTGPRTATNRRRAHARVAAPRRGGGDMVDRRVDCGHALSNRGPARFRKEVGCLQRITKNST